MNTNTVSTASMSTPSKSAIRRTARFLAGAMFATTAITTATATFSGSSAQALPFLCPPTCIPLVPVFDPALIDIVFPFIPVKNVKVTISDSRSAVALNDNPIYTITVRNLWSSPANGVSVLNNVPAGLSGLVWSCSQGAGSSCGAPNGSGSINQIVNLAPQSFVAFTSSSLVSTAAASISNSVTVIPPAAFGDNNAADNSAVDVDTVTPPATTTTAAPATTTTAAPAPTTTTAPAPTTTAPVVAVAPPVIVNPTTTVAPTPATTQAPAPTSTQPQTIVVIVKQEGPAATAAPAKKAPAKKVVAKKKVAKKKIVVKKK